MMEGVSKQFDKAGATKAARDIEIEDADLKGADKVRSRNLRCPHCHSLTDCRTSRPVTVTFRELYFQCTNPPCGHTFKASLSYDYGLSPSGIPDPDLDLPMRQMDRIPGETIHARDGPDRDDPNQPRLFE